MKYFVLVFICNLLSSGRLQEIYNGNRNLLIPENAWRNSNGQIQGNVDPKPCAREGNSVNNQPEETFASLDAPKHTTPLPYEKQHLRHPVIKNEDLYENLNNPSLEITTPKIQDRQDTVTSRRQEAEPDIFPFIPNNLVERRSDNDYLIEPSNALDSEPKSAYNSAPFNSFDEYRNSRSESQPEQYTENSNRLSDAEKETSLNKRTLSDSQNKCLMEEPINSRRSMSPNADELESEFEKSKPPYPEGQVQDHLRASGNKKLNKDDISKPYEKIPTTSIDRKEPRMNRPHESSDARREMYEPTSGSTNMERSPLTLMQSERICYACSTASNPTCWAPDRRTTVKYCRKGNNACITKTFGSGSTYTLIRDCGRSCDDPDMGGLGPRYKSCSMCHSELCNGAFSINGQSIIFALFLTALVKYMY